MTAEHLEDFYHRYIDCLNHQDWPNLASFVSQDVQHNGRNLGVSGYQKMLVDDFERIPDLHFKVELIVANPPMLAARLRFDVTPKDEFLGLPVNGRRVSFTENVFYEIEGGKIERVWSVLDKLAIESQLGAAPTT